jgi:AcrR family transcriptional regulator
VPRRPQIDRERVLAAALEVADEGGVAALTMRAVAQRLGTSPMAIYHYVATKDELLDGLVDLVFAEIEPPSPDGPWREEISRRMGAAREALRRHPWAIGLMESRTSPGAASLSRHEATLATLRHNGFSVAATAHAYALIDSYVYGFALQEATLPVDGPEGFGELAEQMMPTFDADYPFMAEIAREHVLQPGYDFADEFDIGRELVLDALETLRMGQTAARG